MPILSFCPFSFAFSTCVAVLATGSSNSVFGLPLSAFLAFSPFLQDVLIFCCLFIWKFYLFGPLSTINVGIFACSQCTHLIRCFWCMWSMFLNKSFYLGFFLWQILLLLCLSYLFVFVFFWPFLALVFWPLFLYTAFQF